MNAKVMSVKILELEQKMNVKITKNDKRRRVLLYFGILSVRKFVKLIIVKY